MTGSAATTQRAVALLNQLPSESERIHRRQHAEFVVQRTLTH
jgi:hypothetical protein